MGKNLTKTFNLSFKCKCINNGFVSGFIMKRSLTIRECKHILNRLLGIMVNGRDDFDCKEDYDDYNDGICEYVNGWLKGDIEDSAIMDEFSGDCSDEQLGIWNAFKVVEYLLKLKVI